MAMSVEPLSPAFDGTTRTNSLSSSAQADDPVIRDLAGLYPNR
jgi:hypothetical protein